MAETALSAPAAQPTLQKGAVWTLCAGHLVNDLCTVGLVPALLPLYKAAFHLNYTQTGLIVLLSYLTSSVSQPLFGWWTDRKPRPWFVPAGVALSSGGLALTGLAPSYGWVLLWICLSGLGSAVFHPEAMRGTHLAAGQARGLAQAIFQVGGNAGLALGPLMLPLFILATGLRGVAAFLVLSAAAFALTWRLLPWFRRRLQEAHRYKRQLAGENRVWAVLLFCLVVIMRSWSQIGVAGFLPFYYQHQNISLARADLMTFLFLAAGALGTFMGGALSDWLGMKRVMVGSLALALPFALLLPHVQGWLAAGVLLVFGFSLLSSAAVSVVYIQMLMPRNIALASALNVGFGVGAGGLGAALFGRMADVFGVGTIFTLVGVLPAIGALLCACLPSDRKLSQSVVVK